MLVSKVVKMTAQIYIPVPGAVVFDDGNDREAGFFFANASQVFNLSLIRFIQVAQ